MYTGCLLLFVYFVNVVLAVLFHTRLTEFFLNPVACFVLPFISQTKQSYECTCTYHKCKQVACNVVVACLLVYPFFILHFAVACLLLNPRKLLLLVYLFIPFLYTDVVAIL